MRFLDVSITPGAPGAWAAAVMVAVASTTCSNDHGPLSPGRPLPPGRSAVPGELYPLPNAPEPLVTPTYDGSGQTVEPTVLHFPEGWRGHPYWMAVSPYPYGDATLENPSILVSEDGLSWSVPAGLTNPLALPTEGTLSDATLLHDEATDALWVYYVEDVMVGAMDFQTMARLTSSDGIHWSSPEIVLRGESNALMSPSVVKVGGLFTMWTVDGGPRGCRTRASKVTRRTSSDGVRWTPPEPIDLVQPGYVIWHANVIQVPETGRLLALYAAFPERRACGRTSLFLADSDGERWETRERAVLGPGDGWDDQQIYRSAPLYDATTTKLRVWYSARQRETRAWHVGYTEGLLGSAAR